MQAEVVEANITMCGGDKIHGILKELTLNAGWRDPRRVTIYSVHPNPPLHLPLPFIVEPTVVFWKLYFFLDYLGSIPIINSK